MVIEWSDEDRAYLVTLPEWAARVLMPATRGSTYDAAVRNGEEVLRMLVRDARGLGEPLPAPRVFAQAS